MASETCEELVHAFAGLAGSVEITPELALPLAGYGRRHAPFAAISDALEANAVVIRSGDRVCVFLSLDLLYVGSGLRNRIAASIADRVASEDLFVSASHTHFAPASDPQLPMLGATSEAYVDFVTRRVAAMLDRLLRGAPAPVSVIHTTGTADHSINRRLSVFGLGKDFPPLRTRVEMRPNPDGPRDESLRLLVLRGRGGAPIAVCWGYACHPVCFPRTNCISADFPGVVRRALRKNFGSIPVIYWQGFSGDTRPRTMRSASTGPLGIQRPSAFVPFSDDGWNEWSGSLAARVVEVAGAPGRTLAGEIRSRRWTVPLSELGPDSAGRDLSIQEIALGPDFSVFGISAELVSAYSSLLIRARGASDVIPVGCLDGVPGYIPTGDMVPQGGYEARGFMKLFGVTGEFRQDVTKIVDATIFQSPGAT